MSEQPTKLVLVVDDNREVRTTITSILTALGIPVIEAEDGVQGLIAYRKYGPENFVGALIDLMMPQLDGMQIVAELKQGNPRLLTVLCTGYPNMISQNQWKEKGFDAILAKPFSAEKFKSLFLKAIMDA